MPAFCGVSNREEVAATVWGLRRICEGILGFLTCSCQRSERKSVMGRASPCLRKKEMALSLGTWM